MERRTSRVLYPATMQELFGTLARNEGASLYETGLCGTGAGSGRTLALPELVISGDRLAELHRVDRTERYIDIGSRAAINGVFRLGGIVPEALRLALDCQCPRLLRGIASFGGLLCGAGQDTGANGAAPVAAALIALDARCELRTGASSRWTGFSRLGGSPDGISPSGISPSGGSGEVLVRVRIPLERWDFTLCRRFDACGGAEDGGGAFIVFLARIQNGILSDVRVVFACDGGRGARPVRDRNIETGIIGKKLPLARKDAASFTRLWRDSLEDLAPPFTRSRLLAFIEDAALRFTD